MTPDKDRLIEGVDYIIHKYDTGFDIEFLTKKAKEDFDRKFDNLINQLFPNKLT